MAGITEMNVEAPRSVAATESKDAILLIAHGSARYPLAARPAEAHLARLTAADPTRFVALGLLNGTPSVAQALAALHAPRIRAVPFFMEDGWFTRVAVPAALVGDARVVLCPPIGVHPGMARLIIDSLHRGCAERGLDPTGTAVLIVGHGSARAPGRALALHQHTGMWSPHPGAFGAIVLARPASRNHRPRRMRFRRYDSGRLPSLAFLPVRADMFATICQPR